MATPRDATTPEATARDRTNDPSTNEEPASATADDLEHLLEKLALQACTPLAADYGVIAIRGLAAEIVWRFAVDRGGRRIGAASVAEPGQGSAAIAIDGNAPVVIEGFPANPAFPPGDFSRRARARLALGAGRAGARPARARDRRFGGRLAHPGDDRRSSSAARHRTRLLHEANRARIAAESAVRAKGHALSMITHELKTPLQAVLGYTELLDLGLDGPMLSDAQRDRLQRVRSAAGHMLTRVVLPRWRDSG